MRWHASHGLLGAGLVLFLLNKWVDSPIIGSLAVIAFLIAAIWRMSGWQFFGDDTANRLITGTLFMGSIFSGLLVLFYFFVPLFTFGLSFATLVITALVLTFVPSDPQRLAWDSAKAPNGWLLLGAIVDVVLLIQLVLIRTDEALISPWSFLSTSVFVLFGLATFAYGRGAVLSSKWQWYPFAVLHLCVGFGVAVIVYGIGFGFDPFMHRAAEVALVEMGAITPKSLLYSGQYALVAGLHMLTSWSVHWIDLLLVPVLAAASLPAIGFQSLQKGWGVSTDRARYLWLGILSIPFMLLTFTVPFTFTYLLYLLVILALPWMMRSWPVLLAFLSLSGVSLFFHPLLGAPIVTLLVILALLTIPKLKRYRRSILVIGAIGIALSVPVLMLVYQWRQGEIRETLFIFDQLHYFFNLFRSPYTDPFPFIPPILDFLYEWRYIFPILLALGLPISRYLLKTEKKDILQVYTMLLGGLLFCIALLATQFSYEGVIIHEQGEYALRLLQAWFMIPLVLALVALGKMERISHSIVLLIVSLLITHAWFFSYPQYNLKFPYLSPSVGRVDIEAVHAIDAWSAGDSYIVLSHQMMSAAAVQEFGFRDYIEYGDEEHLWYAIPTGGQMYALYTDFLYNGINQETLNRVFETSELDRLYFVTHDYWSLSEEQRSNYANAATSIRALDDHLTIYLYCSSYAECEKDHDENTN